MLRKIILILACLVALQSFATETSDNIPLLVWTNEAIVATYTYNSNNLLARQREIAKYFTAQAWIDYTAALQRAKILEAVKQNAYDVSAVALLPPLLKKLDAQTWQANMPLAVLYKNSQYQQKQTLDVTVTFTTAPVGQGVRGLSITSFQTKITKPPCRCEPPPAQAALA